MDGFRNTKVDCLKIIRIKFFELSLLSLDWYAPIGENHFLHPRIMKVALEEIYQQRLFIFERWRFTVFSIHIIPQRLEKISRIRGGWKESRLLQKKLQKGPKPHELTWQQLSCVGGPGSGVGRHHHDACKLLCCGAGHDLVESPLRKSGVEKAGGPVKYWASSWNKNHPYTTHIT